MCFWVKGFCKGSYVGSTSNDMQIKCMCYVY